jgi:hypothetical protein
VRRINIDKEQWLFLVEAAINVEVLMKGWEFLDI